MTDVLTDLRTEGDALARLAGGLDGALTPGTERSVTRSFARLTEVSRQVIRSVATSSALSAVAGSLRETVRAWLADHHRATDLLAAAPAGTEIPWTDGPLRPSVLAAAALSELFAHGQDITDVLGIEPVRNDSCGHVAYYGVRTRDAVYRRNGLTPPATPFRFELTAPSGTLWEFGPAEATDRIAGPGEDFCLLVTGRRPLSALMLVASGKQASHWLTLVSP